MKTLKIISIVLIVLYILYCLKSIENYNDYSLFQQPRIKERLEEDATDEVEPTTSASTTSASTTSASTTSASTTSASTTSASTTSAPTTSKKDTKRNIEFKLNLNITNIIIIKQELSNLLLISPNRITNIILSNCGQVCTTVKLTINIARPNIDKYTNNNKSSTQIINIFKNIVESYYKKQIVNISNTQTSNNSGTTPVSQISTKYNDSSLILNEDDDDEYEYEDEDEETPTIPIKGYKTDEEDTPPTPTEEDTSPTPTEEDTPPTPTEDIPLTPTEEETLIDRGPEGKPSTQHDAIEFNENAFTQPRLERFEDNFILMNINIEYGIKIIDNNKNSNLLSNIKSNIISKNDTIIDTLVKQKKSFALYYMVTKESITKENTVNIPSETIKMYLTVPLTIKYNPCDEENGMLTFNEKLTKGAVFNISEVERIFEKQNVPYKYIDYYKIRYNNINEKWYVHSMFYNLILRYNKYSISYCQNNCDKNNENGLCAQEQIRKIDTFKSMYVNKDDNHGLKNLIKFKIEKDDNISSTVTPYFISMDPEEKIHFITNNYSKITDIGIDNDYKTIVQVPIYNDHEHYHTQPEYDTYWKSYQSKNIDIKGLSSIYNQAEIDDYQSAASFSIPQTKVDKNDAYKLYAYNFSIEIIEDDVYEKLPLN